MACPFNKDSLDKLKAFIELCVKSPAIIHTPELRFFKEYLESLDATLPSPPTKPMDSTTPQPDCKAHEHKDVEEESDPESDLEIDLEGCIDPDVVKDLDMGDTSKVPTEEESDKADEKRMEAMSQISEGNYDNAIKLLTEAIILNPASAVLFVKRGQSFVQLKKPNACIQDCTRALELNPDSAPGYKFRGRAYRLLGEWEKAASDLRLACKIDFDEQADEWLKEVTPKAQKIEQHRLKHDRKISEKEIKEKLERVRKAKEAHAKAAQDNAEGAFDAKDGAGLGDFYKIFQDPEIMAAFQDPEIATAFQDISTNPANFMKYQSNPKVKDFLAKLSTKVQGSGGFPGFPGMGAFPGMGGFPGAAPPSSEPKFPDDILD